MENCVNLKLPVRTVLVNSGRFDDVCDILSKLVKSTQSDFPVLTKVSGNRIVNRVTLKDVVTGIGKWHELIYTSGEHTSNDDAEALEALSYLIESELEMRLHNYAVACAHRKNPDEKELEDIRTYEVLNSTLDHFIGRFCDPDTGEFWGFTIPDGWCKVA